MIVNQFPDRIIEVDQQPYLYFGGTAYLGMPTNSKFQELIIKNIQRWGTAYGSSRNANIKLGAYESGEAFLSNYINAEAAVTVSSGMLAAKLAIAELRQQTDVFVHFPNCHTALQVEDSIPFLIGNEINPRLLNNTKEHITLLTDAVASFTIAAVDLSLVQQIHPNKEISLLIDESHSLGILGNNGCGIYASIDSKNIKRKIMVASLGKAMGVTGGVIASDNEFIKKINLHPVFVSSAGMNPAFIAAMAEAKEIYQEQHLKLKSNLHYVNSLLNNNEKLPFNQDYPIIYPEIHDINKILKNNRIIVTNFRYATLGTDLNRIVFTANHTKEDLEKISTVLNQA